MIRNETVFILGAGASMPYGFPSGQELVDNILALDTTNATGDPKLHALINVGHDTAHIRQFQDALRVSQYNSINAFLERRSEFMAVGKHAIALSLLPCESPNSFRSQTAPRGGYSWYRMLLNVAMESADIDEFALNKVAFVTFNYDRSLEQFFYVTLAQRYRGVTEGQVADTIQKIPIIHVHGQLGRLPWQVGGPKDEIEYGSSYVAPYLERAANGIKIISEVRDADTSPEFLQARERIESAKLVYFLGFGFHPENVSRLKVFPFDEDGGRQVRGTCFGATDRQKCAWQNRFPDLVLGRTDHKIDTFLMHDDPFLSNEQ